MPATEQTWRNAKWMHLVFGLTALVMLLTTLWMYAADHNREWKNHQETFFNRVEVWNLKARQDEEESKQYDQTLTARKDEKEAQQQTVPSQPLIEGFALEQEYFHNRSWLEPIELPKNETPAKGVAAKPEMGGPAPLAVAYAALLNRNQNLLDLESATAATAVDLDLARADAKLAAGDQERHAQLQAAIKSLEAKLAGQTATLEQSRQQASAHLAAYRKELTGAKKQDGTTRFVEFKDAQPVRDLEDQLAKAPAEGRQAIRGKLLGAMREQIDTARFLEEVAQIDMKFGRQNLDVARSDFDLRLGEGATKEELDALQREVNRLTAEVETLEKDYLSLNRHRKQLDAVLTAATAGETAAQKAIDRQEAEVKRLKEQREQASAALGKTLLSMPILDAFYNSPLIGLRDKQRWLPDLTIDRNFNRVARFDRCEACHLGILKAAPNDPLQPAYEAQVTLPNESRPQPILLPTPKRVRKTEKIKDEADIVEAYLQRSDGDKELPALFAKSGALRPFVGLIGGVPGEDEVPVPKTLPSDFSDADLSQFVTAVYGLHLAEKGLWNEDEPIVDYVVRETPAADARLQRGDVIIAVNGGPIATRQEALRLLAAPPQWGQPISLGIRRGTPQPYSTHPRLELYGTDLSPHPFGKFGCTICHDGQGNGTEFKWASHTPNTLSQAEDWARQHGWFDNLHWIYPMRPQRFAQSNCLKCHHDVTDLEPSERFPEPPAANLMEGYHTIRTYGCFGCHEIKGYDGPTKRIGPDLRLEPNYFAAAEQLQFLFKDKLKPAEKRDDRELQDKLADFRKRPEDNTLRRELQQLLRARNLQPHEFIVADVLKDEDAPGKLRKVGPSLRHVGSKLDSQFLYSQIQNPAGFRSTSRMPQFFGLTEGPHSIFRETKDPDDPKHERTIPNEGKRADEAAAADGKSTKQLEQVEILSIVKYLEAKSQPLELKKAPPASRLAKPRDEKQPLARGKHLFQTRGCLACHTHDAFPEGKENQGPDLSHVGDKLLGQNGQNADRGRTWLYNWLLDPTNYHTRTKMPNTFLTPFKEKVKKDEPEVEVDPAQEIAEFLLNSRAGAGVWKPAALPDAGALKQSIASLAIEHLQGGSGFTRSQALSYLENGIPAVLGPELKGDEIELLQNAEGKFNADQQLVYLGRRSISKYGCFACHDVPGFEAAKPIGTGLAEWGRKETSKIAFEQIASFIGKTDMAKFGGEHGGHGFDFKTLGDQDPSKAFFLNSLVHHQREGFLWQKLREPRSFDFEKTQNKKYNERLKMPRFRFAPDNPDQTESAENARIRERVMTFVLGLVSEAPADKYLYRPDPRRAAINEGRRILTKYNCGGCHTLEMSEWRLSFQPDEPLLNIPRTYDTEFPFLRPQVSADVLQRSLREDERGLRHATVTGTRALDPNTGLPLLQEHPDIEGKYQLGIELWKPAVINGRAWLAGDTAIVMKENAHELRPPVGGTLSRLLPAVVYQHDKSLQAAELPSASMKSPKDALAFVPPPLLNEGRKVQTTWLHDFLLDPHPIRPMVVLRMPRFNMSADEAGALVNYFAAVDGVEYPYAFDSRTRTEHLEREQERFPGRLDDSKKFVQTICLQCHRLGDFTPTRYDQAPNLGDVYHRLRPEFLKKWLANPKRLLPYTGMPENQIPPKTPLDKSKFAVPVGPLFDPATSHATSEDQLSGVVDFLLNYDRFAREHQKEKIEALKNPAEKEKEGEKKPGGG